MKIVGNFAVSCKWKWKVLHFDIAYNIYMCVCVQIYDCYFINFEISFLLKILTY